MLLAIDTSVGTSVAVVDRDSVLAEASSTDSRGHAEVIGDLLVQALAGWGGEIASLSGVVVGMGPGPFTGLRVGIAAGRVFALGAGTTVAPVVSHDAVAFGVADPILVTTDARRHEVYWSAYDGSDEAGLPIRVAGPALSRPEHLESVVPGFTAYRRVEPTTVSAGALGRLAETLYSHQRAFATNEALYLREPDVTISAGPKRVS